MSRQIRLGYGRLAAVALAVVASTWGAGSAVAAAGSATASGTLAAVTTAPGTTAPGTTAPGATTSPLPSGTGSGPVQGSLTPCPPGPGTGGTGAPPASDFEDGGLGTWTADAGVTLTNTGEVAADGTRSLRAEGVTPTAGVNLPSHYSTQAPGGGWLRVTAKVRLAAGSSPAYVQLTPTSAYSTVPGVVRATADAWTTVTAWYYPGTVYWDNFCNGQMYGGSYPSLASLKVLLSGDACADATAGPVTLFVDEVVTELVSSSAPPTGPPPGPASTPQCGSVPSSHTSPPAPVCTARYDTVNRWSTGYLATLHVVNASGKPLPARTLAWQFPGKQVITSLWGAKDYRQSGRQVTVTTAARPVAAAPGRAVDVGFIATGTPGVPQSVTLDGNLCTVSAD